MYKPPLLFAASEVYPFAKSGGLADVAHSLPRALASEYEVSVVMPLYRCIDREKYAISALGEAFEIEMGGVKYPVELFGCEYEGLRHIFIYSPLLSEKEFLYGTPEKGYEDNAVRFGIFNYVIVSLLKRRQYAIAHLNDWQSALVPLLLKDEETVNTKILYTIHNLAYQGTFEKSSLAELGLDEECFTMEGIEFYGMLSFMKAGIAYADRVTTVSPTYAKEILTPEFGCGLEGFLRHHRHKLSGIINGINAEHFSPEHDRALVAPYSDLSGKVLNKKAYLREVGLKGAKKPLFVFVGRFTSQKGLDLLLQSLPKMASTECNIAFLGEGEEKYHVALKEIMSRHPNIYLEFGYNEAHSHRMYAAADFLLMPSLFEPCGLNQMIAMTYGTMPLVHRVGGLADTVFAYTDFEPLTNRGYGVVFAKPREGLFLKAFEQARVLYKNKRHYNRIIKHNMRCDFSWQESSKAYLELYAQLLK
jgi:starch synthase